MLTRLLTAGGRYPRTTLGLGLTAAAAYLAAHSWTPTLRDRAFPTLVAASFAFFVLALMVFARVRPRAFDVRPHVPAFTTRRSAGDIYLPLAHLALATAGTGQLLDDFTTGDPAAGRWFVLVWPVLAVIGTVGGWRGTGIELRPDGFRDREVLGSLVVPWDALPVVPLPGPTDRRTTLLVRYVHPERVRRRGLVTSRNRLTTHNIDPQLAAQAIRFYATHPERRSAIGTHAEYRRLLTEIQDPPKVAG